MSFTLQAHSAATGCQDGTMTECLSPDSGQRLTTYRRMQLRAAIAMLNGSCTGHTRERLSTFARPTTALWVAPEAEAMSAGAPLASSDRYAVLASGAAT